VHGKLDGVGRFVSPWLLILTSLADGPKHGYAIMADVADFSGVRMEPGTLYGALSRLERRGWVRWPSPNAAAVMRSPPHGQAGRVKALRQIARRPGRRMAAAVDTCLPVAVLTTN